MGIPTSRRATKYGIMNAPPPFCAAWPGKRRKLPSPTADPETARIERERLRLENSFYAGLTILSAWIALALAAAAGRAMSAGYPVSALIIAAAGAGFLSLGLLKMLPSYCQSLTTESALQAGLRHAEEIARAMEGAKEAAPAEVPAQDQPMKMPPLGSAPVAQFDAETYFQATWRDADLSHEHFQRSIDEAAKDLWRFPLILLRDRARGRLVAMRNTKVPWVSRLSWEKMERELTIAEILARIGLWIDSWQDFIGSGKANSADFEKAMAFQSKEAFLACEHVIDRLKQDVPIWKKEFFEDGAVWVGLGP